MTNSNSKNMTLESRIVETLKEDHLMKLVGDEDAITELVTRAIKEAMFQTRTTYDHYNKATQTDSVVIATAKEVATKYATNVVEKFVKELMEDEARANIIREMVIDALPQIILKTVQTSFDYNMERKYMETSSKNISALKHLILHT